MRQGLQTGMENQIAGLTTEGGLTREQAEKQLQGIKEQNYQNDLKIVGIENEIYNIQTLMIPYKDQIANYDKAIAGYSETIWQRNQQIYDLQTNSIGPIEKINKDLESRLNTSEKQLAIDIEKSTLELNNQLDILDLGLKSLEQTQAQEAATGNLATQWKNVADQIASANRLLKDQKEKYNTAVIEAGTNKVDIKAAKDSLAAAQDQYNKTISGLTERAIQLGTQAKYKGGIIGYSAGSVGGVGGRDSVSAMLTPGEYVVRKASVNKYGTAMFDKINTGSFSMPRYNMGSSTPSSVQASPAVSNINAPVYNTYSINIPVTQPGASADEIANKVMTKIRNVDNSSIRRINGY